MILIIRMLKFGCKYSKKFWIFVGLIISYIYLDLDFCKYILILEFIKEIFFIYESF